MNTDNLGGDALLLRLAILSIYVTYNVRMSIIQLEPLLPVPCGVPGVQQYPPNLVLSLLDEVHFGQIIM